MCCLQREVPNVTLTRDTQCRLPSLLTLTCIVAFYTKLLIAIRCFGAASAKDRLDVVIRDAINAGDIPGPRYLANGKEMARRDGDLVPGITAYADGPGEMREVIRHHVNLGVDQIKLSMSGEEVNNKFEFSSHVNAG